MTNEKKKTTEAKFSEKLEEFYFCIGFCFALLFFVVAYYRSIPPFTGILIALGIFESVSTALFLFGSPFIMLSTFLYQHIVDFLFVALLLLVGLDIIEPNKADQLFDKYNLHQLKAFVEMNPILVVLLLNIVWFARTKVASHFIICENAASRKKNGNCDDYAGLRNALNLAAFTFFITMSYCVTGKEARDSCFILAIVELLMFVSCSLDSRFMFYMYFWYQAMMFVVPSFLLVTAICFQELPNETLTFLQSHGLTEVGMFMGTRPLFALFLLWTAWFIRLLMHEFKVIDKETDHYIKMMRRFAQNNRVSTKQPSVLIDRSVPLINTV